MGDFSVVTSINYIQQIFSPGQDFWKVLYTFIKNPLSGWYIVLNLFSQQSFIKISV